MADGKEILMMEYLVRYILISRKNPEIEPADFTFRMPYRISPVIPRVGEVVEYGESLIPYTIKNIKHRLEEDDLEGTPRTTHVITLTGFFE